MRVGDGAAALPPRRRVRVVTVLLGEFQGHLSRRPPTQDELARRPSCRLTPRDLEILEAANGHPLLTAELVGLALFPPDRADPRYASSRAYARLRSLWLWGYLDRFTLPAPRGYVGGVPDLFALGPQGRHLVTRRLQSRLRPARAKPEELDVRFVQHELLVATAWAHLRALVRTRRLCACRWTPERAWRTPRRYARDPADGERLRVLPDGAAALAYLDGTERLCAVEIDRGTLTNDDLGKKLRAWEGYVGGGHLARDHGRSDATLLVLVDDWGTLAARWKLGREAVPERSWGRYLLGRTELLAPGRFADEVGWLALDGQYHALLDALLPRGGMAGKGD
jgi:hypothetical protein